jgi:hypothetical protein
MKTTATYLGVLILSFVLTGCDSMPQSQPGGVPGSSGTSLSSIAPRSVAVGSPDLTVTVIGSHFAGDRHYYSQAVWSVNGSNTLLATTFVSSSQLSAVIPAALLNSFVTAQVFVQTGDPMGDIELLKSNAVSFSVTQPWLTVSPNSAAAGSPDLSLTLLGQCFTSAVHRINRVVWSANGTVTTLSATFVSSTQLNAVVPAELLGTPGNAQVWVEIWDIMGDVPDFTSNSENFTVSP